MPARMSCDAEAPPGEASMMMMMMMMVMMR